MQRRCFRFLLSQVVNTQLISIHFLENQLQLITENTKQKYTLRRCLFIVYPLVFIVTSSQNTTDFNLLSRKIKPKGALINNIRSHTIHSAVTLVDGPLEDRSYPPHIPSHACTNAVKSSSVLQGLRRGQSDAAGDRVAAVHSCA